MSAIRFLLPMAILACCSGISPEASAALTAVSNSLNPGSACQLSIPTTDTEVRPKATGYRNESTTKTSFVICGYPKSANSGAGNVSRFYLYFVSIDGVSRSISCTGVSGMSGFYTPTYSTKSRASMADGNYAVMIWEPADFGGSTEIPNSVAPSVTCTLPPQTAITMVSDVYNFEIGS